MQNDLSVFPWAPGQFHQVSNYWEAVGVIAAKRAGIDPASVRRPLDETAVVEFTAHKRGTVAGSHSAEKTRS